MLCPGLSEVIRTSTRQETSTVRGRNHVGNPYICQAEPLNWLTVAHSTGDFEARISSRERMVTFFHRIGWFSAENSNKTHVVFPGTTRDFPQHPTLRSLAVPASPFRLYMMPIHRISEMAIHLTFRDLRSELGIAPHRRLLKRPTLSAVSIPFEDPVELGSSLECLRHSSFCVTTC